MADPAAGAEHRTSAGRELVDVIGDDGVATGTATRADVRSGNLLHRSVFIAVVTSDDHVIAHQRADWKDVWPSRWDICFGGVLDAGEAMERAAVRELAEEAGVVVAPDRLHDLGEERDQDDHVREIGHVYLVRSDGPFVFADGEVARVEHVALGSFAAWLDAHDLCPDSRALVAPHLLALGDEVSGLWNAPAFLLLTITAAFAVVDWMAVHQKNKPLEYVAKPLTMVMLIGAVEAMQPSNNTARSFFVVAMVFSLLGDIFLMLPNRERWFVFGLGSFLVGHLAYIPGLLLLNFEPRAFLVGLLVVAVAIATIGRKIVSGVRAEQPKLAMPVTVYMSVISVMLASAIGTARVLPIVGAALFYGSDALIAWNGFIKPLRWGPVGIMVTYHLAQITLALSLI